METIVHKASAGRVADTYTFVMTTESPDGVNDIVVLAGLDTVEFQKNPVALLGHDMRQMPVGIWKNLRIQGDALLADLQLAAKGTSRAADLARGLIEQGILRACSIGFRVHKSEPLKPRGMRFLKSQLLECSLVSVPANPRALIVAKSLGMTDTEIKEFFSEPVGDFAEEEAAEQQALRLKAAKARAVQALINATRITRKTGELHEYFIRPY